MTPAETRLLQLVQERSFKRGDFQLASGGRSSYYIDGRMTVVFSEAAQLIGEVIYERTRDLAIDAIGGLATGAIPLTTAAVIAYHQHGRKLEGFWVRDAAKQHGTQKVIEGNLQPGMRVVVVDDVFTSGGSALKACQEVTKLGCEVVLVLALVDRLVGAEQKFKEQGIANYQAIFTIRDLGVEAS